MGKKKATKQKKLKVGYVYPAFRERIDIDYFDRLPPEAQKYLQKFVNEVYGHKYGSRPLVKKPEMRKQINAEDYAARMDIFSFFVRVNVDPTSVELEDSTSTGQHIRVKEKSPKKKDD